MRTEARRPHHAAEGTEGLAESPVSPNRLRTAGPVAVPNRVWMSDFTCIPTRQSWRCLAAVMDLGSRRIKGRSLSDTMRADLVADACLQATFRSRPGPGMLFHSDRGSQYASGQFRDLIGRHGAVPSMSAKGNCCDNAAMKSFRATLKSEMGMNEPFETQEDARLGIFDYIEVFCNRQRLHSSLGCCSPLDCEQQLMRQNTGPSMSEISG